MLQRTFSLAMLPMILATLSGCAGQSVEPAKVAAAPAEVVTIPAGLIFDSCAKPVYPEAARHEKRHGEAVLAFQIDADGTMLDVKVKRSSGHADLDEAARVGLSKCKFRAATQNGSPVRDWAVVRYHWVL